MRKCPKCGMEYPYKGRMQCNASLGDGKKCDTPTVEIPEWTNEDEAKAMEDLDEGILSDPFEDYEEPITTDEVPLTEEQVKEHDPNLKPEPKEDLREDLNSQADQIHDLLETYGSLTYKQLAEQLNVSAKRASNIVSTMIRDGVKLKREGKPRKVSIG